MRINELKEIARENCYEFSCDYYNILLRKEVKVLGTTFKTSIRIGRLSGNSVLILCSGYTDDSDINMIEGAIAYAKTPLGDREEPKRYIVPLPGLVTTDGEQQYLTNKSGRFFASRRNKDLRQTWKEEHLCHVPEQYRGYAVEVDE